MLGPRSSIFIYLIVYQMKICKISHTIEKVVYEF